MQFFLTNEQPFKEYLESIKNKYDNCFVFGNAPSLNLIDDNWVNNNKNEKTITIGINRAFKRLASDLLFFTDCTMDNEVKANIKDIRCERIVRITRFDTMKEIRYWAEYHKFNDDFSDTLQVYRNTLTSALHFCKLINVKNLFLFGVQMDTRSYFYGSHPRNYPLDKNYDDSELLGYNTQKMMKENIEYEMKGIKIYWTGESKFLSTLTQIGHVEINQIKGML